VTLRWFLADLATGRYKMDLPVLSGRWQRLLNRPETIECTLDLRDPDVIALLPRLSTAPARTVLAVAKGDVVLAAGPIWARNYSVDDRELTLSAKGVWSYYDHRFILPVVAASLATTSFSVTDPDNEGGMMPNPDLRTFLTGWELGTIAKKLIQQAHEWTGGVLPIVFEDDRAGTHERSFEGPEFKNLGDVLRQLQDVDGGPDVRFLPRFTDDRLSIEWLLQTGTEADPLLSGGSLHRWDASVHGSAVSNLQIRDDASALASLGWASGGKSADTSLVSRAYDPNLVDQGYPLFEELDSGHSTVSVQATLDAHAANVVGYGSAPTEVWSFDVEANSQPFLGAYFEGDFCEVDVAPYKRSFVTGLPEYIDGLFLPGTADEVDPDLYSPEGFASVGEGLYQGPMTSEGLITGDPYLYDGGSFQHRIVSIGGDEKGDTVRVECAPRFSS
jgi:hypothetical protein